MVSVERSGAEPGPEKRDASGRPADVANRGRRPPDRDDFGPYVPETPRISVVPRREILGGTEREFRDTTVNGVRAALSDIQQAFEDPLDLENRLAFHGQLHTRGTIARIGIILRAVRAANLESDFITQRDIRLGKLAMARHDFPQRWRSGVVKDAEGNEIRIRKRAVGENERESAQLAEEFMRSVNERVGTRFSERGIQVVRETIQLTEPKFVFGTVIHPRFADYKGNPVAQAGALADVEGGSMEGFQTARWEANALYVEDNLDFDIYRTAFHERGGRSRDKRLERVFHDRAIAWIESQVDFSRGRRDQLEQAISSMDPRARRPVRRLFAKHDEVIEGLRSYADQIRKMDSLEWMTDLQASLEAGPLLR
jgi:hypothetical protein